MRKTLGAMLIALLLAGCAESQKEPEPNVTITGPAHPFVMDIGVEYDHCGIGIALVFIPRTASSGANDMEPVIYGGPINNMDDTVSRLVGTDPMPANAAKAVPGTEITIMGKRFMVVFLDAGDKQVTVSPVCAA